MIGESSTQIDVQEAKSLPHATDEKPFACTYCPQSFARLHNLKSHIFVHTGEKPWKCDSCSLAFARQHDLKRHQRLHEGIKPFKCVHCNRMFSRQDALNRHLRAEKAPCCGLARKESKLFSSPTSSQMSSSQISTPLMESYYMDPFMNYYEQPIEGLQTENQVLRQQLFELQRSSQEKIDRLEDRIKELEMQLMHQ